MLNRLPHLAFPPLLVLAGCMGEAGPGIAPAPSQPPTASSSDPSQPAPDKKLVPSSNGIGFSPKALVPQSAPK